MANDFESKDETTTTFFAEKERQRNVFDIIGDFFAKMIKGIFIFTFCKVPIKIWEIITNIEQLKKIIKLLYSILRAIFLCMLWVGIVFLGWWYFLNEQFIKFWHGVWEFICLAFTNLQLFLKANAGWIWMILALCGSLYGLIYVTRKRRKKRKLAEANNTPKTEESNNAPKTEESNNAPKAEESNNAPKTAETNNAPKTAESIDKITQPEENQTIFVERNK